MDGWMEIVEAVRELNDRRALGMDEIRPKFIKALHVVWLSWLTQLCNILQ